MKKEDKLHQADTYSRTYCKCGHGVTMLPSTEKSICSVCGRYVKNMSRTRFRYMMWKYKEMRKENE